MSKRDYLILTDSGCDLPESYISAHGIRVMPLTYEIGGVVYDGKQTPFQPVQDFYVQMRSGAMPKTSQANVLACRQTFEDICNEGMNLLYICFSSGLSGTYQSACIAAEEVNEHFGEQRVYVVDSLCASMGQGLLVHHAMLQKEAGASIKEAAAFTEKTRLHICHNFTVSDLHFLYLGGRVSKTAAMFGTMLNIKPVLHVDDAGHLIPLSKARGRKASLDALVDNMGKCLGNYTNDICFISHGDAPEDAQYVADRVRERYGIQEFLISYIGPVIGAHSGPGTVALFFVGDHRKP